MPFISQPLARGSFGRAPTMAQAATNALGPPTQPDVPPLTLPTQARADAPALGTSPLRAPPQPFMRGPPDQRESFLPPGFGGTPPGAPSFAGSGQSAGLPDQAQGNAYGLTGAAPGPSRPRVFAPSPLNARMAAGALPLGGFGPNFGNAMNSPAFQQWLLGGGNLGG